MDTIEDVIQILREPAEGDRSVDSYRKRQACQRITADFPNADKASPDLIQLLADPRCALAATAALQRIALLVPDQLLAAARDPQASIRFGAIHALVPLGKKAEPLMLDLAQNDPDPAVSSTATFFLCSIGTPDASPMVVTLLRNPNERLRIATLRAIRNWPLTREVAVGVARLTCDNSTELRRMAVDLLVKDPSHFPDVLTCLRSTQFPSGYAGEYEALEVLAVYPHQLWGGAFECMRSPDYRSASLACDLY